MHVKEMTIKQHKALRDLPLLANRLAMRWQYAQDQYERDGVKAAVNEVRPARYATWLATLVMKRLYDADQNSAAWFAEFMRPMKLDAKKKRAPFHSVRKVKKGDSEVADLGADPI